VKASILEIRYFLYPEMKDSLECEYLVLRRVLRVEEMGFVVVWVGVRVVSGKWLYIFEIIKLTP